MRSLIALLLLIATPSLADCELPPTIEGEIREAFRTQAAQGFMTGLLQQVNARSIQESKVDLSPHGEAVASWWRDALSQDLEPALNTVEPRFFQVFGESPGCASVLDLAKNPQRRLLNRPWHQLSRAEQAEVRNLRQQLAQIGQQVGQIVQHLTPEITETALESIGPERLDEIHAEFDRALPAIRSGREPRPASKPPTRQAP